MYKDHGATHTTKIKTEPKLTSDFLKKKKKFKKFLQDNLIGIEDLILSIIYLKSAPEPWIT